MTEYIEREALLEHCYKQPGRMISDISICMFPAADVAPVVRGEWIAVPNSGIGNTAKCSCCGKCIYGYVAMKYCPECGADMRKRKCDE